MRPSSMMRYIMFRSNTTVPMNVAAMIAIGKANFLCICLKYGNIGPIRGALNGLRPAVVALICAASLSFIWLALWNVEDVPKNWDDFSAPACIILMIALVATHKKVGVIKVLIGSGVLGLVFGMMGLL